MRNKINFRELNLILLTSSLSALVIGISDFYQSENNLRYLVFIFVWIGIKTVISGIVELISPTPKPVPDAKELANKAIIKEFFK